ncbi:substrate-binding periplasmic protein [Rhodoferax sp.]|uniref:substrate-binding periplasmic protein n=1 Tax=Rhodoferax sp. TaxID=50421 RepID=UPI002ACDAAB3|nr:transporter substrate-binding domain-containing protein [Rhodoferax sp.]MDZ7918808.1 transporter substrate-binding domain-containing protein [Rhodoferax sp.]
MAYTEHWPPYNFAESGKVQGIATDVLRAACELAELRCSFQVVPWARGYRVVRNTPNTVLYTTARKPSREDHFVWVGPLLPRTTWVYTRNISGQPVRDAKELAQLRIGVVREEAAQQDLQAAGVPASALVEESSNDAVFRMLMGDMVQAMVDTEVGMAWNLRSVGRPAGSVTKLLKLSDDGGYYFALNRQTNPLMVRKLQQAVDKLRAEGRLDAIVKNYEPAP